MSTQATDTHRTRHAELWGRFEGLRDHLFEQHRHVPFDESTGLSGAELEEEVARWLEGNGHESRVIQKARVTEIVLTKGRIAIDPEDWFVDKLDQGATGPAKDSNCNGIVSRLSLSWLEEAIAGPLSATSAFLDLAREAGLASVPQGGLDRGHISLGWDFMLSEGLSGLLARVQKARAAATAGVGESGHFPASRSVQPNFRGTALTAQQRDFYDAVEIVYTAAIELGRRFSRLATEMATSRPEHAERLSIIAEAMAVVPARRPETFHQALQFLWFMHELVELEGERVRSMGQFDRTLYPFYRADIDAGRLTKAQAKELILFFWYKWYARTRGEANGKNFCFAGRYADGSEITNELTYLALDAHEQLRTPDPKLSVRFGPDAPNGLYRRVAELIRSGEHSLVLLNDSVAVDALIARGKSPEDARCYLPIGCYEPAVEGKEIGCTMNITVNLAKCLELALHDGVDPATGKRLGPPTGRPAELESFEAVRQAYTTQVNAFLERSLACIGAAESEWPRINPSPLPAGTFESCIERGKDIGQGGPVYNSVGFVGAGLANVVDSLVALRQVVFDERRLSMAELVAALDADFAGREPLRMYLLNRPPKWGNNDETADAVGVLVAEHYCDKVHTFTNKRGGTCQAALFTLTFALRGGKRTGALPDGRRAGESLAPGQGAGYGRDRNGVTALLGSVAKLDGTKTPNGAVVDVTLQPNVVEGETGIANLVSLIKTYFALGGYGLQFNIFDLETLKAAQRYPERYATLQVRVTGWSVYFTSLTRLEQDQYLARIAHSH